VPGAAAVRAHESDTEGVTSREAIRALREELFFELLHCDLRSAWISFLAIRRLRRLARRGKKAQFALPR
jgi:hypothetical protein